MVGLLYNRVSSFANRDPAWYRDLRLAARKYNFADESSSEASDVALGSRFDSIPQPLSSKDPV